jgi:hypothetical protein
MIFHEYVLDKTCHVAAVQPYTMSSAPRAASDVYDPQNVAPPRGDASGHTMTGTTRHGIRVAEESRGALERAKKSRTTYVLMNRARHTACRTRARGKRRSALQCFGTVQMC